MSAIARPPGAKQLKATASAHNPTSAAWRVTAVLDEMYGPLLIVRAPCPVLLSKGSANYKSEVGHLAYSPRRAYDEWLAILDAIVAARGDALC